MSARASAIALVTTNLRAAAAKVRAAAAKVRAAAEALQAIDYHFGTVDDLYASADELARTAARVQKTTPGEAAEHVAFDARLILHPTTCTCNQCERGRDL